MPFPDLFARRELLQTRPNAHSRRDYLIRRTGSMRWNAHMVTVALTYVPDRHSLEQVAWDLYLAELAGWSFAVAEHLAAAIIDDVANQLVPRWAEVRLDTQGVTVLMEDRQPDWDNPGLLSRLAKF